MVSRLAARLERRAGAPGFTMIELLVVLAIVAMLLTIAMPRYFSSVDAAKESALIQTLTASRNAIDHFYSDKGRYPDSLQELVDKRYLRSLPMDPILGNTSEWLLVAPQSDVKGLVQDIRSSAPGKNRDGKPFIDL